MALLNKAIVWLIIKHFFNFVFFDVMLAPQFFNYVFEPNEAFNVHTIILSILPYRRQPSRAHRQNNVINPQICEIIPTFERKGVCRTAIRVVQ